MQYPFREPCRSLTTMLICVVIIELLTWSLYRGPEPKSADAPDNDFSSARAMQIHEALFPDQPHPAGSIQNEQVRDRLVEMLRQLGMRVEVTPWVAASEGRIVLSNVLAEMPGRKPDGRDSATHSGARPLVLATHYDSCRAGPGAADDGAAVAAMIETARALQHVAPLNRPIYLLFTDGEELGLLGARQFVQSDPVSARKPYVLAFDARGNRGPAVMYETHDGNSAAIAAWIPHLAKPRVTGSMFTAVSRNLPNFSDFQAFAPAGWHGFNFALIGGAHDYHQPGDTRANLDRRSVQHIGDNALSLAKVIAATDTDLPTTSDNAVFFDLFGRCVVQYPSRWSLPLSLVAFMAVAAANRRRAGLPGFIRAGVRVAACTCAIVVVCSATGWLWSRLLHDVGGLPRRFVWYGHWIVLGLLLVSAFISLGVARWSLRGCSGERVWAAAWLWWAVAGVGAAAFASEFSHLLLFPSILAALLSLTRLRVEPRSVLASLGHAGLTVPVLHLFAITLGPSAGAILCPAFALAFLPLHPVLAMSDVESDLNTAANPTG